MLSITRSLLVCVGLAGVLTAEPRVRFDESVSPLPPAEASTRRELPAKNAGDRMEFSVAFKLRNYAQMQARIARGEIIPRQELEQNHLPLQQDYDAVVSWLVSEGFAITLTDPSRLAVYARGTHEQIRKSLQVHFSAVTSKGKDYPAVDTSPSLPQSIAAPVLGINHLQPFRQLSKHAMPKPSPQSQGTPGQPPFLVSEILKAYNGQSMGVSGANQKIAILIDTFPNASDLTAFWSANSISQSLSNVEMINVNSATLASPSGEETLDAEWTSGVAPNAKIRIYAAGSLAFSALDKCLQQMISDLPTQTQMHQLSISLGLGETYMNSSQFTTDSQYFATLASGGVSIFVSTGDYGSTPNSSNGNNGSLQVEYFSSDPSVTGVGGTSLTVSGTTGLRTSETAWSGSGGGVSRHFSRPSWQTGTGVPAGTMRCVPDVALTADPNTGAYVYLNGGVWQYGGTSWSAPMWAGLCAMVNEARANLGKGPIGLMNPSLYPLVGTSNFTDITSGSNSTPYSGGLYSTNTGYDNVTGLGVPNISTLVTTLSAQTPGVLSFSPGSGVINTQVVISGYYFSSASAVSFNGTPATYTLNSSTQITTNVPSGATTGPISVTTPNGTGTSSSNFTVSPTFSGFSPAYGLPGSSVTITGLSLTGATAVSFNGTAASFTVNSDTQITTTVPAGATSGILSVTTPGGTASSASSFTVLTGTGAPTIASFTPAYGTSGTTVVITGTNYVSVTGVSFNGTAATFTVNSPTQITATAPSGVTAGPISVTTPNGTGTSSSNFTVPPTVSGFSPSYSLPGAAVMITGLHLTGATAVFFNGTAAFFTVNSDTQITATVPAGATSGILSVTAPGGTGSSTSSFTVLTGTGAPTITSFTPVSGLAGSTVVITGTNYVSVTGVSFNGTAATFTVNSPTQITATAPPGVTTGSISVTNAYGTGASSSNFTLSPTIAGFSPAYGLQGSTVTVTGTNLSGATVFSFNGTAASFTVNSDTQITTTVPSGATSGVLSVTTPGGTASTASSFTVLTGSGAPTITSFTPIFGRVGSTVVITGTNFVSVSGVSFNGTAATYTVNSPTQITTTAPSGVTTGTMSVTTSLGTGVSTDSFTVYPSNVGPVVISQVYGGGGSSGATYTNDFVEIYNRSALAIDLTGYSLQYAAYNSSAWSVISLSSTTIQPGKYYLIKLGSSGSSGAVLPTADLTYNLNISYNRGKVALVNTTTALNVSNPSGLASVVDLVGYGSGTNGYEGSGPTSTLAVNTAAMRLGYGSTDTGNNSTDFTTGTPNPHNSSSPAALPDLAVGVSHSGNFTRSDTADTYTISVTNSGSTPTNAPVSLTDTIPTGLTATAISGTGWTCNLSNLTCTRSDSVAAGSSYPPITLTVSVASNAGSPLVNSATVSGGGESNVSNDTANDSTIVNLPTATVTLGSLAQTYDGSPKPVSVTTVPSNLSVAVTYNGSSTVPTNAGSYTVVATVTDANYLGSASGTLVVSKAAATMTLGSLAQTYTGSARVATATTSPSGLTVTFTYNGSGTAPTTAGSYTVVGTISDTNYQGSSGGTLVVSKATATVTLGSLAQTYNGSGRVATATTSPSGLTVTFTYNGSGTAPTTVGNYTVVGTISDTNYQGSSSGTLVISKATATVTLGSLAQTYTGSACSATATTNPTGLTVSFIYNGSGTAPTVVGNYAVVGTISDANYQGSSSGTLVVSKATATVTLGSLAQTYTGSACSATAITNPTGLMVSFTYNGSGTAPTTAGSYAVVGTINDTNYQGSSSDTLVVSKATATVTLGSLTQTYDGGEKSATATTNPGSLTVTFTYNGSGAAPTTAGSYAVVGTINDTNYQGSSSGTLIVSKALATVTLGSLAQTYDGGAKSATATTNPGSLTVTFTYNGSGTAPIVAGSYTVVGTISDTNYQGSSSETLVISKAIATVTLGSLAQTYDGGTKVATATTSPTGLTITFTYNGSATAPSAVGSYTVVGTIVDTNYQGNATETMVVSKGTAGITLGALAQTYDGSAKSATATSSPSSLTVTFTYDGSSNLPVNAGSYAVVATIVDTNYQGTVSGTLVVSKATTTVTLGSLAQTYNGGAKSATASTNPGSLTVNFTYNGSGTAPTNSGSYAVVGTISDANYQGSASGTLVVSKAAAIMTLGSLTQTYDGGAKSATAATNPGNLTVTFTYNGSRTAPTVAGSYTVIGTVDDTNYQGSSGDTLVISKATASVTLGSLAQAYDGGAKVATVTTSPSSLSITFTYNGSATAPSAIGSYTVVATVVDSNYQGDATGTLEISKGTAGITLGALAQTYDGSAKSAIATTNPSNLTVTFTYDGSSVLPVNAGSYAVVATIVDANYQGTVSGTLTVSKATATVTLGSLVWYYDGGVKTATATATPVGLTVDLTYGGSLVAPSAVGSYTVVGTISDTNYQGTSNATLQIYGETISAWRARLFTANEIAAGAADDNANPAGDGMTNLSKYALGADPHAWTAQPSAVRGPGGLSLTFTRPNNLPDVVYAAESSDDMVHWSPVTLQLVTDGPTQTMRAVDPLTSGNTAQRFIRLVFTR